MPSITSTRSCFAGAAAAAVVSRKARRESGIADSISQGGLRGHRPQCALRVIEPLIDELPRDSHRGLRAVLHSQNHVLMVFSHRQIVGGKLLQMIAQDVRERRRGYSLAGLDQERIPAQAID